MTTVRTATCRCGQLQAICTGEPFRISVCHCLNCQRRSGSAFAAQARWPDDQVEITGAFQRWTAVSESGVRTHFRFCPGCGATIAFANESFPGNTAIPTGAFADPGFPPPHLSIFEERKHGWVAMIGDGIEHYD